MWEIKEIYRPDHEGVEMESKSDSINTEKNGKDIAKDEKTINKEEVKIIPDDSTDIVEDTHDVISQTVAKSGKRSAKSLKETEFKAEKEARKLQSSDDNDSVPKKVIKPTRTRLERKGKNFKNSAKLVDKSKLYSLEEAIDLVKKTSYVKFDATVELHAKLGVDPRLADQNIRDTLVLPAGTGKLLKVAVLTDDTDAAIKAGADLAGTEELLNQLEKGSISFDVLIATPLLMPKLGKYARLLGPRGLMPSPKSGTVTNDVSKAVSEAKAGKVEYRVDSTGIVHLGIGKVSFSNDKLLTNAQAVLASIKSNKPNSIKGIYLKSLYLTSTMGPSVVLDNSSIN